MFTFDILEAVLLGRMVVRRPELALEDLPNLPNVMTPPLAVIRVKDVCFGKESEVLIDNCYSVSVFASSPEL